MKENIKLKKENIGEEKSSIDEYKAAIVKLTEENSAQKVGKS